MLGSRRFDAVLVGEHPQGVKGGEVLKQRQVGRQCVPCIVIPSAARHPFEAHFYARAAHNAVTPKWNHRGIVEQIRQSLQHSDGTINGFMAGEQSSVCA